MADRDDQLPTGEDAFAETGIVALPADASGFDEEAAILDDARGARRERGRRALAATGRGIAALVGLAGAAALVVGLSLVDLPVAGPAEAGRTVQPSGVAGIQVCAGAPLLLTGDPSSSSLSLRERGRVDLELSEAVERAALVTPAVDADERGPVAIEPTGDGAYAGATSTEVWSSEISGLAAASCAPTSSDQWLVGGSTTTGRTTLLLLSNPSEIAAEVTVQVLAGADDGTIRAGRMTVAAGAREVVSLAAYASGVEAPVVHVSSRGGRIAAQLQQTVTRGIDPGGVDIVGAAPAPAETMVIPGVRIADAERTGAIAGTVGSDDGADLTPVVRVAATGGSTASVRISLTPTEATESSMEPGAEQDTVFEVPAGTTRDIPLGDLPDGVYRVDVTADAPIVAAVRASTGRGSRSDLAWFQAAEEFTGTAALAVADGGTPTLTLAAGETDTTVRLTVDGVEKSVTIAAGGVRAVRVRAGTTILTADDPVRASVDLVDTSKLAGYPVLPQAAALGSVVVYP